MRSITVCIFGMVALLGIVSSADMPQVVYIHYSTPEEAEAARKKILAEYEGATIIMGDDPLLAALNVTSPDLPEILATPAEILETPAEKVDSETIAATTTPAVSSTEAADKDKE